MCRSSCGTLKNPHWSKNPWVLSTGNGDVSTWVKNSQVGCKTQNKQTNKNLYTALMPIEHWGFFSMPHLPLNGTCVYVVIFEDPWHSEHLVVELSLLFLWLLLLKIFLAHLNRRLKWALLIKICPLSVVVVVGVVLNFSHFHLLLQNHSTNINQTWHKASVSERDSSLFKWRALPFSNGR